MTSARKPGSVQDMAGLEDVLVRCLELDEFLKEERNKDKRKEIIRNHLETVCTNLKYSIPDFAADQNWLNVAEPLTLSTHLKGKLLVLDFFTYCCINCMHVLPHLEELEHRHNIQNGLVVVGVHSAKFLNEKSTSNILSAILRYSITHPVINDSEALMWQQLQIDCWPTFVIVGPGKEFLFIIAGEKNKDLLFEYVEVSLEYFREKKEILSHNIPLCLERDKREKSPLQFPGKVSLREHNELVISNTGNHSILIVTENGLVKEKIGGVKGYRDGCFQEAQFSSPQGTAALGNLVFVADTDNHVIRQIDLVEQKVNTIVGTGHQGYDTEGGKTGIYQEISSPWDLVVGTSPDSTEPDVLYIAMAGTHQVWVYFLKDATWYKNQQFKAKTCLRFAGSGSEANRNNSYPQRAAFAQPSGLALSPRGDLNSLYVADAESSTVRQILLKDGAVKALVGGERDPMNLFAFGDEDGVGVEARLQHPLGVSLASEFGPLIVADSYNNKIKSIDLKTKLCSTVFGCGLLGNHLTDNLLGAELNEPGGVCVDHSKQLVYIADTNNHAIRVFSLTTNTFTELPVIFPSPTENQKDSDSIESPVTPDRIFDPVTVGAGRQLQVELTVQLKHGEHLNEDAPNSWKIIISDDAEAAGHKTLKGHLKRCHQQTVTDLVVPQAGGHSQMSVVLVVQLFICQADNMCTVRTVAIKQPLNIVQRETQTQHLTFHVDTSQL